MERRGREGEESKEWAKIYMSHIDTVREGRKSLADILDHLHRF